MLVEAPENTNESGPAIGMIKPALLSSVPDVQSNGLILTLTVSEDVARASRKKMNSSGVPAEAVLIDETILVKESVRQQLVENVGAAPTDTESGITWPLSASV